MIVDFSTSTVPILTGTDEDGRPVRYYPEAGGNGVDVSAADTYDVRTGAGDDIIVTWVGDDAVRSGAGDDRISSGSGEDFIDGGAGIDFWTADHSSSSELFRLNLLTGAYAGPGTVRNIEHVNLRLGSGADIVITSAANLDDWISGGEGNDAASFAGGTDFFDGGEGIDRLSVDLSAQLGPVTSSSSNGAGEFRSESGSLSISYVDVEDFKIVGSSYDDVLVAGSGNDVIHGGRGNDVIDTGLGDYDIDGGAGIDHWVADLSNSGPERYVLLDLQKDDHFYVSSIESVHLRFGSRGVSIVTFDARYDDTIFGGAGSDNVSFFGGHDYFDGGDGWDRLTVDFSAETTGISTMIVEGTLAIEMRTHDGLSSVTYLSVSELYLTGGSGGDRLWGGDYTDRLDGGSGVDVLSGGRGDDQYWVDNVNDIVIENSGGGRDVVYASASFSAAGQDIEEIRALGSNRLNLAGNSLENTLFGNDATNALSGGAGADLMVGGNGSDVYTVDNLRDVVVEQFNEGIDLVKAGVTWTLGSNTENLWLVTNRQINAIGNELNNTIVGNDRANVIIGFGGRDLMTGNAGTDRFDFHDVADSPWNAYDRITDLESVDVINLSLIDADTTTAGNQAFVLADHFSGVAGQLTLTFVASGNFTVLGADVDGDGVGDFRVILNGNHTDYDNFRL